MTFRTSPSWCFGVRGLIPAMFLFTACGAQQGGRTINASIGGGAGLTLYLEKFAGNKPTHIDSVKLDANGIHPLNLYHISLSNTVDIL